MQTLAKFVLRHAAAVAFSSLASAGVLTVGGSNPAYTDMPAAVAAAVDGDVLLVRAGGYSAFTINGKAISIIADTGANVGSGACVVQNLPAGKTVLIAGLKFNYTFTLPSLKLENNAGRVRIESVFATTAAYPLGATYPPVIVTQCADVAFASCTFVGPSGSNGGLGYTSMALPALVSTSSTLTLYHCSLNGGEGLAGGMSSMGLPFAGRPGAAALSGTDTRFFARGSTLVGGKGGNGLSLSNCQSGYAYPTAGGEGGAGLSLQGGLSQGKFVASIAQGGSGGLGGSDTCGHQYPQALDGPSVEANPGVVAIQPGPAIRLAVPQPAREGQNISLHFEAPAGSNVLLLIGNGGAGYTDLPALNGVLLLQSPLRRLALGTVPPSGILDVLLPVPLDLGVGVDANLVHTQAVFIDALGRTHLADPGVVVMLDSAF